MAVVLFFVIHWYSSLFCQSFFMHRYSAHRICTMSPFWEKFFFVASWITQGASYISPYTYGIMHRLHHVYTDKPKDPHSPSNSSGLLKMMLDTRNNYQDIYQEKVEIEQKYKNNLPEWHSFDRFAHNWVSRLLWMAIYVTFWAFFATEWWHWLFLGGTLMIGTMQGAMVNYFAHIVGYRNFKLDNTSYNLFPFFDLFLWGEAYHNNHHKYAGRPNNAIKWFEWDPLYTVMLGMDFLHIIRLKKTFNEKKAEVF